MLTAPSHGAAAASPPCKQLVVRPDAMKNHHLAPNAIDKQKVGAQVTFRQPGPIRAALVEAVFPKGLRQRSAGDHHFEDVLESLGFEFRMLS